MGFNFGAFAGGAATGFSAGFEMAQKYKEREDKRKQEEQDAINKASKERQDNIKDATKALGDYMSVREKNLAIYNDGSASTKDRNIAYGTLKGSAAKLSSLASGYDLKKYPEIGKLLEITNSDLKSFNSSMEMLKDYEAENGNKYVVPFSANLKGATVDDAGNLRFKKMDETGKFTNELLDISIEPSEIAEQKDYGSKTMYRYDETTGKQDSVVVKSKEQEEFYKKQNFGDIKYDTSEKKSDKNNKNKVLTGVEFQKNKDEIKKSLKFEGTWLTNIFGDNENMVDDVLQKIQNIKDIDGKPIGIEGAVGLMNSATDVDWAGDEIDIDKIMELDTIPDYIKRGFADAIKYARDGDLGSVKMIKNPESGKLEAISFRKKEWEEFKNGISRHYKDTDPKEATIEIKDKFGIEISEEELSTSSSEINKQDIIDSMTTTERRKYNKMSSKQKENFLKIIAKRKK